MKPSSARNGGRLALRLSQGARTLARREPTIHPPTSVLWLALPSTARSAAQQSPPTVRESAVACWAVFAMANARDPRVFVAAGDGRQAFGDRLELWAEEGDRVTFRAGALAA